MNSVSFTATSVSRQMAPPSIFMGIGAMKSGTTWLYNILGLHPDCALCPQKELHFFEGKYAPQPDHPEYYVATHFDHVAKLTLALASDLRKHLRKRGSPNRGLFEDGFLEDFDLDARVDEIMTFTELLRLRDFDSYIAYFEQLRARKGAKIAGEITATYADLPAEVFREIVRRIDGVRFVYIMRDPAERFWSHVRFDLGRAGDDDLDPNALIHDLLEDELLLARSDYKKVIEKLESVIDPSRIFYAFYERLTARDSIVAEIRSLEKFLSLAPVEATTLLSCVDQPENVSPKMAFSSANRQKTRAALNHVYAFVEKKFGALPPGWEGG
jgi:hypothetical protein